MLRAGNESGAKSRVRRELSRHEGAARRHPDRDQQSGVNGLTCFGSSSELGSLE